MHTPTTLTPLAYSPNRLARSENNVNSFDSKECLLINKVSSNSNDNRDDIGEEFCYNLSDNQLFNESRAYFWAIMLRNEHYGSKLVTDDSEILNIRLDSINQRVIKNDSNRTRSNIFDPLLKDYLEIILTFYCKREMISYKQGLNEVAAPFVYFKISQIMISDIYNYFASFIQKFLPNTYVDNDFLSLQCNLRVFYMLLKYHDPNFHNFLEINGVTPEIYAIPWFLTLFASKLKLEALYLFWDIYLMENDEYLIFFICIALILENKTEIMKTDMSSLPMLLANLKFETPLEIKQIYTKALHVKACTPDSFILKIKELKIYRRDYTIDNQSRDKMHKNMLYLENLPCLMIKAFEVIHKIYPNELKCSYKYCKKNAHLFFSSEFNHNMTKSNLSSDNELEIEQNIVNGDSPKLNQKEIRVNKSNLSLNCKFCKNCFGKPFSDDLNILIQNIPYLKQIMNDVKKPRNEVDFLIIDLREKKENGILPKSHIVDTENLTQNTITKLIDDMIELKYKYHFAFMISNYNSMESYMNYEKIDQTTEFSPSKKTEINQISQKEEQILYAFVNEFLQNGFPYVSVIEGGYTVIENINLTITMFLSEKFTLQECHNLIMSLKQDIINHNINICKLCMFNNQKNQSNASIFTRLLNRVIGDSTSKNRNDNHTSSKNHNNSSMDLLSINTATKNDNGNTLQFNNTLNSNEVSVPSITPNISKWVKYSRDQITQSNTDSPSIRNKLIQKFLIDHDTSLDKNEIAESREKKLSVLENTYDINKNIKFTDIYKEGEENIESSRIISSSDETPIKQFPEFRDKKEKNPYLIYSNSPNKPKNTIFFSNDEEVWNFNDQKTKNNIIHPMLNKEKALNPSKYAFKIHKNPGNDGICAFNSEQNSDLLLKSTSQNLICITNINERAKTEANEIIHHKYKNSQEFLDGRRSVICSRFEITETSPANTLPKEINFFTNNSSVANLTNELEELEKSLNSKSLPICSSLRQTNLLINPFGKIGNAHFLSNESNEHEGNDSIPILWEHSSVTSGVAIIPTSNIKNSRLEKNVEKSLNNQFSNCNNQHDHGESNSYLCSKKLVLDDKLFLKNIKTSNSNSNPNIKLEYNQTNMPTLNEAELVSNNGVLYSGYLESSQNGFFSKNIISSNKKTLNIVENNLNRSIKPSNVFNTNNDFNINADTFKNSIYYPSLFPNNMMTFSAPSKINNINDRLLESFNNNKSEHESYLGFEPSIMNSSEYNEMNMSKSSKNERMNDYYKNNGILKPITLKEKGIKSLLMSLIDCSFSYFIVQYITDIRYKGDMSHNQYNLSQDNLIKCILISTDELIIIILYNEKLINILSNLKYQNIQLEKKFIDNEKFKQDITSKTSYNLRKAKNINNNYIQKTQQYREHITSNSRVQKNLLINQDDGNIKKINIHHQKTNSFSSSNDIAANSNYDYTCLIKEDIIIKSIFPLKLLLRITSKINYPNYLSFYFKMPNIMNDNHPKNYYKILNILDLDFEVHNFLTFIKEDEGFHNITKKMNEAKEENNYAQIKAIYIMQNDQIAKNCISKIKERYNKITHNIP